MEREKLQAAPGIFCYREPLGIRFVSFYALDDGDGITLFDTAVPGVVTWWINQGEMQEGIKRVIISHSDADHLGDTAALKERYPNLQVLCHPRDQSWIEDHDLIVQERYDHVRPTHDFGYDQATLHVLREMCGPNFEVDELINDGDEIQIGSRSWEVIHAPGHSLGHISLWCAADGILLLGDAVLGFGPPDFAGTPSMPSTHQYIADYLETLDRFDNLPAELVLTAHWPFLSNEEFKQLIADSRERVARDLDVILQACREKPQAYGDLVGLLSDAFRTWPDEEDTSYMFALSGSLEYLQDQGQIKMVGDLYAV